MGNLNLDALNTVALWLEAGAPETTGPRFDMLSTLEIPEELLPDIEQLASNNWCGTSACIAGAAMAFCDPTAVTEMALNQPASLSGMDLPLWDRAQQLLNLTDDQAQELFAPWNAEHLNYQPQPRAITPARAATTIRHLIATGEVNWHTTTSNPAT